MNIKNGVKRKESTSLRKPRLSFSVNAEVSTTAMNVEKSEAEKLMTTKRNLE